MAATGSATLLQCEDRWLQGRTHAAYRINGNARCTFTDEEGIYDNRETNWPVVVRTFEESMRQASAEEKPLLLPMKGTTRESQQSQSLLIWAGVNASINTHTMRNLG